MSLPSDHEQEPALLLWGDVPGTSCASPATATCPSSSSLPAKAVDGWPVGTQSWDMAGHGLGWVGGAEGSRTVQGSGIEDTVNLWGQPGWHFAGACPCTSNSSTSRASELPMSWFPGFGRIRGGEKCVLFSSWGKQGGFSVPLHPGSHGCQRGAKVHTLHPAQLPSAGRGTHTSVPSLEDRFSPG